MPHKGLYRITQYHKATKKGPITRATNAARYLAPMSAPHNIVRGLGMGKNNSLSEKQIEATPKSAVSYQPSTNSKDSPPHHFQLHSFTSERFHALLNSLFKVLFNFPSRYLFAIGLVLYLALDGVYHPIRAAISNNPTQEY